MYYLCSENKGADQLRSYREADLRLFFFCICKKPVFSRRGSFELAHDGILKFSYIGEEEEGDEDDDDEIGEDEEVDEEDDEEDEEDEEDEDEDEVGLHTLQKENLEVWNNCTLIRVNKLGWECSKKEMKRTRKTKKMTRKKKWGYIRYVQKENLEV